MPKLFSPCGERMFANRLILVTLVLLCLANGTPAANLRLQRRDASTYDLFVECKIQDFRECYLDTGSEISWFTTKSPLELKSSQSLVTQSYSGEMRAKRYGPVERLVVDRLDLRDIGFDVSEGDESAPAVGLNAFQNTSFTLDFDNTVLLAPSSAPSNVALRRLAVPPKHGLIIEVSIGGENLLAQFDTDSSNSIVDKSFVSSHPSLFAKQSDEQISTMDTTSGTFHTTVAYYKMKAFTVDGQSLQNSSVVVGDIPKRGGIDIQMLIGSDHYVWFNWYFDLKREVWGAWKCKYTP